MMQINMKIKVLVICTSFMTVGIFQSVHSEPASLVAWDAETRDYIQQADVAKGEQIAQTCIACHTLNPKDLQEGFPSLSGQRAEYIFKQLMDYKQEKRIGLSIMPNFVIKLDKPSMAAVAVWFSQQNIPEKITATVPDNIKKIVFKGDSARFVPACAACHGLEGQGSIVDIPALAGMSSSYFKTTMQHFKSAQRHNDIYKRMRLIASKLSTEEIQSLAEYYSSIGQ